MNKDKILKIKEEMLSKARLFKEEPVYQNYTNPYQIEKDLDKLMVYEVLSEEEVDEICDWMQGCVEM